MAAFELAGKMWSERSFVRNGDRDQGEPVFEWPKERAEGAHPSRLRTSFLAAAKNGARGIGVESGRGEAQSQSRHAERETMPVLAKF